MPARNQVNPKNADNSQQLNYKFNIFDRSLKNNPAGDRVQIPEDLLTILKRLADGGFLANNRQLILDVGWSRGPWLFQVIRSMNNLETLSLLDCQLTLSDLPQLLRSSTKLTYLRLKLIDRLKLEMNEELKNELRSAFQRLQIIGLSWDIDSWPVIQEIFT